jgi:cysteine synthase A
LTPGTSADLFEAVGNTPLVRLPRLSEALGRTVLAKAEHLNPGGSVKDRAAKRIIEEAEASGVLKPGGTIVEGTAGNTGIALALFANARGYKTIIVIPDDQSQEKIGLLRTIGADVRLVPSVPYTDEKNYYHVARRTAEQTPNSIWADQFNNGANFRAHFETTGPEIWDQSGGAIDAFTCASGTGGTIAGVTAALKQRKPSLRTVLADPAGSSLFSYVKTGTLDFEGESITEGIGIKRITENFKQAKIDDAVRVDDATTVEMIYYLLREEGLFVGGSASLNVVAAAKVALDLPPGSTVATILCDGGARYSSRLFDAGWLTEHRLTPRAAGLEFLGR